MSVPTYLPLAQAARQIGRSVDTLRRWIATGRLRAVRLPDANGRLYVLAADLHLGPEPAETGRPEKPRRTQRPRQSKADREAEEFLQSEGVL